ncbi:MAG: FAD-dependent oxidoreductase [Atribacterota bacterium]|nr:FAD-dependent oxidoreductase [Atribacterota bacterium]
MVLKERIFSDVLVIGGGLAGLTSALEVCSNNSNVTIVSKGRVGRSGNSIVSATALSVLVPNSEDSVELFYKDIIESGQGINDKQLVEHFVINSTKSIFKLKQYGLEFLKDTTGLIKRRVPGHSVPRTISLDYSKSQNKKCKGLLLTIPLLDMLKRGGANIIDNTSIIKLLVSRKNRNVYGAIGINTKANKIIIFHANVIILASGGGGKLYIKSDNTNDITSDSYSLAYDAGALLKDMEYVQFYPTMLYKPIRTIIPTSIFSDGAILRNSLGEDFMQKYDKSGNMATRDIMSRAIFTEIIKGRGIDESVFLDCKNIPKNIFVDKYIEINEILSREGIDYKKNLLPISPVFHFYIGGIVINSKSETSLKGLLACGEAVGGLHGANRLGGNALSEAIVFGITAGKRAVELLKEKNNVIYKFNKNEINEVEGFRKGKLFRKEWKDEICKTMWNCASILKNRDSLEKARQDITSILNCLSDDVEIKNLKELKLYYELKSILFTSQLIVEGAFLRKESRGAHYRTDFAKLNENFKGNYFFEKLNDKLNIYFKSL